MKQSEATSNDTTLNEDDPDVSLANYLSPLAAHRALAAGEVLYSQGDVATSVYRLEGGRIRLVRHTVEGKAVTLRVVRPGDLFAETDLFYDEHQCDALGDIASSVTVYSKSGLKQAMADNPVLMQGLLKQAHSLVDALKYRIELLMIRSASDRILQYLHYLGSSDPTDQSVIRFDRPYKHVAEDLGLSPEAFYRTLARLEQEGRIFRHKRLITLLDA